jgi:predicted DNA-binding transcriptional regulator AlpA
MTKRARSKRRAIGSRVERLAPKSDANDFIPGPKLRAKLGISAVTLWRWRHDEANGFPPPKVIKGRLYFPLGAVSDWIARQPTAA